MVAPVPKLKTSELFEELEHINYEGRFYLPEIQAKLSEIEAEAENLIKSSDEAVKLGAYNLLLIVSGYQFKEEKNQKLWQQLSHLFNDKFIIYNNQVGVYEKLGLWDKAIKLHKDNVFFFENLARFEGLGVGYRIYFDDNYLQFVNDIWEKIEPQIKTADSYSRLKANVEYLNNVNSFAFNEMDKKIVRFVLEFLPKNKLILIQNILRQPIYQITDPEDGSTSTCYDFYVMRPQTEEDFEYIISINDKLQQALLDEFGYEALKGFSISLCCED